MVQYECRCPNQHGISIQTYEEYTQELAPSEDTYSITTDEQSASPVAPPPPPDHALPLAPSSSDPFRLGADYAREKDHARKRSVYDEYDPWKKRALEPRAQPRTAQRKEKLKSGVQANKPSSKPTETWVGQTSVPVKGHSAQLDINIVSDVGKYAEGVVTLKKGNYAVNRFGGRRLAQDQFLITKLYLVGGGSMEVSRLVDLEKQ